MTQPPLVRRDRTAIPIPVMAIGIAAGLLNLAPLIYTQYTTPPGWHFTGNLKVANPDYMQYRVWFRQTQREGPIVEDIFTSEPNRPHLVLLVPYLFGKIGRTLSIAPEWVSAYAGSILVVVFTALLYALIHAFFPERHQRWWVFLATLLGGGFGGHLKLLLRFEAITNHPLIKILLWDPIGEFLLFEDFRGHFVFTTLFDTHFVLNWTICTASVVAFYRYLKRPEWWRLVVAAAMSALMTVVHVYEGITLLMILLGIWLLCAVRRVAVRPASIGLAATATAILVSLAWQWSLRDPNVPIPSWRGQVILPAILFVAYPLVWILVVRGLPRLWREADLSTLFLLGWLLGCTALTLSGPFYPYVDRGTVTLQIPLTILAGLAYFRERSRVTPWASVVAVFILGMTPLWYVGRMANDAINGRRSAAVAQNDAHRRVIETLQTVAERHDVLLALPETLAWLAPEYPGRHYCAHFFLTVDFDRKAAEVRRFFEADSDPTAQEEFLRSRGIRFVFVEPRQNPNRFSAVPGLRLVVSTPEGSLFAYHGAL